MFSLVMKSDKDALFIIPLLGTHFFFFVSPLWQHEQYIFLISFLIVPLVLYQKIQVISERGTTSFIYTGQSMLVSFLENISPPVRVTTHYSSYTP